MIELLVVITIIALLIALLLPAIQKAQRLGKDVKCKSNLHQWAIAFQMYSDDYEGAFEPAFSHMDNFWPQTLVGYVGADTGSHGPKAKELMLCPEAPVRKPSTVNLNGSPPHRGSTFYASSPVGWFPSAGPEDYVISFGRNAYLSTPPKENSGDWWFGIPLAILETWRSIDDIRDSNNVPILYDSAWFHMTTKNANQENPPVVPDGVDTAPGGGGIQLNCIDRHLGGINTLFLDSSVRRTGLKEQWTLKWHPIFDTQNAHTIAGGATSNMWPGWMRKYEQY